MREDGLTGPVAAQELRASFLGEMRGKSRRRAGPWAAAEVGAQPVAGGRQKPILWAFGGPVFIRNIAQFSEKR